MRKNHLELLAPAGNAACLHAAVSAGADAVYLGLGEFNARRGAGNFDLGSLGDACDYAHLRGVLVYLALNTVVLPDEINQALEAARQAYRCGVDAFIVQDIGLAAEIGRTLPGARLHVSTQMNSHTADGIEAARQLGAKRVTLARELSLEQISTLGKVAEEAGIELEAFAHGALCVSYSGQCLMSSMIGGRSANRGLCAQACRLPYTLHNLATMKALPAEGEHLLSPKDLCTIDVLGDLVQAGLSSLKIEGRMKSPEYVFTTTSVYRRALDELADASSLPSEGHSRVRVDHAEDKKKLSEVFSRGFSTAYLEGRRGNEIMSYSRPNNRGVCIGRVASETDGAVAIELSDDVAAGDVLEFWTNKGRFTHTVQDASTDRAGRLHLRLQEKAGKGDRVFRVRKAGLVFEDDPLEPRVPVQGRAALILGRPLAIEFSSGGTGEGRQVVGSAEGRPVEAARTKSVLESEVYEHIDRMGNTPFRLEELSIELDDGVGIGFSELHQVRARALGALEENLLASYKGRSLERTQERERPRPAQRGGCEVAVWATNPACARAARKAGADLLYVPALNYKRGQALIAGQISETVESAGYPKQCIMALPTVDPEDGAGPCEGGPGLQAGSLIKPGKPVLVGNLGQLVKAEAAGAAPEAGPHIPLLNSAALDAAFSLGARRAWLSPELSLSQIAELAKESPLPLGLTIIGAQELMLTEHCLLMSQGACTEDCLVCQRRKSPHYLKDRKGYEFTVTTDLYGRSHLFNAVSLDNAHALPELVRAGVTAVMVDTTLMTVAETTKAVQRAVRARDIALRSGDSVSKAEGVTSGHLFRGVT